MFGEIRLGKIAGIDIRLHRSFLIFFVLYSGYQLFTEATFSRFLSETFFFLILFAVVLLHELGHALMARYYGIRTRDITLMPIGGRAQMERIPEVPMQEILISLAGPAVNVALAVLSYMLLLPSIQKQGIEILSYIDSSLLIRFFWLNVVLAIFNLLPAFPMDGGRVLRACLAFKIPYVKATNLAAGIGKFMAVGFIILGVMGNFMLIIIGFFIWTAASAEARYVTLKHARQSAFPFTRWRNLLFYRAGNDG